MMDFLKTIILTILFIIIILVVKDLVYCDKIKKINKSIPGPKEIPILGNLLSLKFNNVPQCMQNLYEQYGEIYRLRLGKVETVVLSGRLLEECFLNKNKFLFQERYIRLSRKLTSGLDIMYTNGDYFQTLKNILLLELTTKKIKSFQNDIELKANETLNKYFNGKNNKMFISYPKKELFLDIMLNFIYGSCPNDDGTKRHILKVLDRLFLSAGQYIYSDYIPFLFPLDVINMVGNNIIKDTYSLIIYSKQMVDTFHNNYEENKEVELTNEVFPKRKSIMQCYYEKYREENIKYESVVMVLVDLMVAGINSTSNTFLFLLARLINNPEIQENVYNEIKRNNYSLDQNQYPYTQSFLKEVHRYYSLVPLSEPHNTSENVEINGFKIAKGTQIIPNLRCTHKSNENWDNPFEFDPERFLKDQKQTYQYGLGIRSCLGGKLADSMLFTVLIILLKNYKFLNPNPNIPINDNGKVGFVMNCFDYSIQVENRIK